MIQKLLRLEAARTICYLPGLPACGSAEGRTRCCYRRGINSAAARTFLKKRLQADERLGPRGLLSVPRRHRAMAPLNGIGS
jgi:hypothetical protein